MRVPFPFSSPPGVLSRDEAAHYLRVTVDLLEWFERYPAKGDGRRLVPDGDGQYTRDGLDDFNAHLTSAWANRTVPAEIGRELERESRGMCILCLTPNDLLEQAHILRRGREVEHFQQHPHNLALLCPNCHTRYDRGLIGISAIRHAKQHALSLLMESVDRDVTLRRAVVEIVQRLREGTMGSADALRDLVSIVKPYIPNIEYLARDVDEVLDHITSSLEDSHPITAEHARRLLESRSLDDASERARFHARIQREVRPGHCASGDGNYAILEEWRCDDCEERGYVYQQPAKVEGGSFGHVEAVYMDDSDPIECSSCESNESITYIWGKTCPTCRGGR